MNTETHFCLRVDVDTFEGLKKGLPNCIKIAEKTGCPISIYLSLGKYATGRNIFRRMKKKESINLKLLPWRRNPVKSILRGLVLPPARIGEKEKNQLRQYNQIENIEIHAHGYNHVNWSSNFSNFTKEKTEKYVDAFISEYKTIFEKKPVANAAPNFQVNTYYFEYLKEMGIKFSSDFIYDNPFILQPYNLVQLPVTEPTIEEYMILGKNLEQIKNEFEKTLKEKKEREMKYVCLYVHAVFEPLKFEILLEEICKLSFKNDMKPVSHYEYYKLFNTFPSLEFSDLFN